jgi:hypothetical protein
VGRFRSPAASNLASTTPGSAPRCLNAAESTANRGRACVDVSLPHSDVYPSVCGVTGVFTIGRKQVWKGGDVLHFRARQDDGSPSWRRVDAAAVVATTRPRRSPRRPRTAACLLEWRADTPGPCTSERMRARVRERRAVGPTERRRSVVHGV